MQDRRVFVCVCVVAGGGVDGGVAKVWAWMKEAWAEARTYPWRSR